ncbi:MAG TPA: EAL domain-containing protein [Gemmatimonadaceae bacterium]|nr:EAL domain-containing protein [Gemmatimonadaceae bacterium]
MTDVSPLAIALGVASVLVLAALILRERWWRGRVSAAEARDGRFRALVQQSSDVTLILDAGLAIRFASPAAGHTFGRAANTLHGEHLHALIHPDDAAAAKRFLEGAAGSRGRVTAEWRVRGAGGQWLWTENTATDLAREASVGGLVVHVRDISERRTLESRLTHQAFHDSLTRLANRSLFLNRVGHAIARAPRLSRPSAVLFLDLDDFKKVNDSLGHGVGDELLIAGAGRLSTCVRPGDTLARLGGDEFAVLLEDLDDMAHAVQIAERISTALRTPFRMQGRDVFIGVSIGIAAVSAEDSPDEVLRNADLAMYFAKGRDKGRWAIYAPEMHAQVLDRLELEADLRAAVAANAIRVEYQPIVRLDSGKVFGAEALVRWDHASRGPVSPSRFVSLAEETGLIVPIGRQVLREACRLARECGVRDRGGAPLRMSVNLSARHFQEASLVADVEEALAASGLEARALTLEITESVLMQRSEQTLGTLRRLKALGLHLAIDDFGTGYSSLGYLQQFPIDMLKIDRTFVESVGRGRDPVLARAIIALGEALHLEAVAEGIERVEQRDGLWAMGCTLGQGYLFARPMSGAELGTYCRRPVRTPTVVDMYAPEGKGTPATPAVPRG